jgi:hypothetical protein
MDGLSMRIWRQGDIVNDTAPARLDIYYGLPGALSPDGLPHSRRRLRQHGAAQRVAPIFTIQENLDGNWKASQ